MKSRHKYETKMNLLKCIILALINEIKAIDIAGHDYKIFNDKRAQLNITTNATSRSVIECATQCERSNECTHANFRNSKCEFLKYESPTTEIIIADDRGSKYICKLHLL